MGDKRTKQRITSKIDELPEDLRMKVDVMLADTSNTYEYISQFLKGRNEYPIQGQHHPSA